MAKRKIPDKTISLMRGLYNQGLSVAEIARRTNVSYPTTYGYTKAREKGFASCSKYNQHLAKQKGFSSYSKYLEYLVKKRGFASRKDYDKYLAEQRGFGSYYKYQKYLAKQRQKQPINKRLSSLIKERLGELEKSQVWLAEELDITEGAVSRYASGRTTPDKKLQGKLFQVLDLPYKTLDDLVE